MKWMQANLAVLLTVLLVSAPASFAAESEALGDYDPWEGFNRKVFVFNDTLDGYLLKPVAKGYKAVTPDSFERAISNVFSNLKEVRNVLNDLLQGKVGQAGNDSGRFLVNIGLL